MRTKGRTTNPSLPRGRIWSRLVVWRRMYDTPTQLTFNSYWKRFILLRSNVSLTLMLTVLWTSTDVLVMSFDSTSWILGSFRVWPMRRDPMVFLKFEIRRRQWYEEGRQARRKILASTGYGDQECTRRIKTYSLEHRQRKALRTDWSRQATKLCEVGHRILISPHHVLWDPVQNIQRAH